MRVETPAASKIFRFVNGITRPESIAIHKREADSSTLNGDDLRLKGQILADWRNRLSPAAVLSQASRLLSPEEQTGIIYFTALVDYVDDLVDNEDITTDTQDSLRENLLRAPLPLPNTSYTIDDLRARMLSMFPEEKKQKLEEFLDDMINFHVGYQRPDVGSYSFNDALHYHQQTSQPYVLMGSYLVGVTDPIRIANHIHGGSAAKFLDDAFDFPDDLNGGYNLLLGLANEYNELPIFQEGVQDLGKGSIPDIRVKCNIIRRASNTRQEYRRQFDNVLKRAPKPTTRAFLGSLSRSLF